MSAAGSPKPKRKRRWWIRVLRTGLLLLVLFVLLLSGALWWAYSERVVLLNNVLTTVGPMRGNVGSFEVTRSGGIELRDLVFTDRATGAVVARVPHVSGQANLNKLPPDEIRSLTLRNPEITITEAMVEAWRKQAAEAGSSTAPPIPFGTRFSKVDIQDARVRFEQTNGTSAEVTLNYQGKDLSVQSGGLATGDQELTISDGRMKTKDGAEAPFSIEKLHVKGRVREGIVELTDAELDKPGLHLTPELLAIFGLDFSGPASGVATGAMPSTVPTASPAIQPSALVRGFRIESVKLRDATLSARGFAHANVSGLNLPDARIQMSYEARGIEWHQGAAPVIARQKAEMRDVSLEAPDDSGHLRFASASFEFETAESGAQWLIESLMLDKPDLRWTPQLRTLLTMQRVAAMVAPAPEAARAPADLAPAVAPAAPRKIPTMLLKQASVTNANVAITDTEIMSFDLHTKGALMLANLRMDASGFHSQSFQTLEVTEGRLVFPTPEGAPAKKPWLELPRGEMVVKPDDWNERTRIAKLDLDRLVVRMRDGNTPWIDTTPPDMVGPPAPGEEPPVVETQPQTANREPASENREPPAEPPWWKRINCGQLTLNQGEADLVLNLPKPVDMHAQVDITTQRMDDGGSQHTVRVADFTGKLPTLSTTPFPVAQAALIEGVVRLPEMWTQRRFDELHLTGASVDLDEALLKLFEREEETDTPDTASPRPEESEFVGPPAPAEAKDNRVQNTDHTPEPPWTVGVFSVKDSAVTVSNLVPGMPAVKFGVSLEVKETPLRAEDLASNVAPQRIEFHNLKIPSPNGTARYVAELDSIFVNFSLAGLMRKEVEGVEIVSPTLFVGEDLFWYVDFYRKYAERGAHPAPPGPYIAAVDDDLDRELARDVAEAEPPASEASWSVKRLQVHSGKLVLAPKGVPLEGFHTPFPFNIDTEVKRGTLNADLEIPPDTYELPSMDLQFIGMRGRVQFNLPLKQKDNNLVETFHVDSVRYKELKTGKAYLTVTYDKAGIYAQFGAEAYEGYLNGQVNVYTDDSFHWDGWIGGKDVQMRDLTRILTPGYFLMNGQVEATLVAQGSMDELYQADGSFKNHTPGEFTITGLESLIKDLPKEWDPMKKQIAKIGLETLRDFEYDHAEMKSRFYGREGKGVLRFKGPNGSRNFDINVIDHRWRTDGDTKLRVTTTIDPPE